MTAMTIQGILECMKTMAYIADTFPSIDVGSTARDEYSSSCNCLNALKT
jgi:hypothetical protein